MSRRIKRLAIFAGIAVQLSCDLNIPDIRVDTFRVSPSQVCALPREVQLDWTGFGVLDLRSDPAVSGFPRNTPDGQHQMGSVTATVTTTPTTFSADARFSDRTDVIDTENAVVERLRAGSTLPISVATACSSGRLVGSAEINPSQFSDDVIVRSLRLTSRHMGAVSVSGPGGTASLTTGTTVPFSGVLTGTWTFSETVIPPCTAVAGGGGGISVVAELGCP